jgi:quercetin dioxygenase-like cupin family protein
MRMSRLSAIAVVCLVAAMLGNGSAFAQQVTAIPAFKEAIANVPGKNLIAVVVNYPPGGKSPPHHHAKSAFITGYVLTGAIRSQVDDGEARIYKAGEHFTETPGAHHRVSENASDTEPAKLLAIFVVDSDATALTTPDK